MEQMWQVCELEESGNIKLSHFERFSVTLVPESWISLLQDGTLLCFWPSVDPASKIRSLHLPEIGEKCKYYKCRILLDGAKFSSYKKAEEAVQIAQNLSSIIDSSVSMGTQKIENACNSTMDFDVAEYANGDVNNDDIFESDTSGFDVSEDNTEEKNEMVEPDSFGFDVSDTDDENGEIVGHDSFEFNKAILKGGLYFSKKAMSFEIENLGNIPIDANDTMLSQNFDYNAKFQSNDANFSTSTAVNDQQTIKKSELSQIMLKISAIEKKVYLFVESIKNEFDDLKEAVKPLKKRETKVVQEKDVFSNSGSWKLDRKEEMRFLNGDDSNIEREKTGGVPLSSQSTLDFVEDVHYENAYVSEHSSDPHHRLQILNIQISPGNDACDELNAQLENTELVPLNSPAIVLNSTNVSAHASDVLNYESPKMLNMEILPVLVDSNIRKVPVDVEDNLMDEVAEFHDDPDALYTDELRFPYNRVDDHIRNENLLEEEVFASALIQLLEPFREEDEATYIERSVRKLFTDDFFLNSVSWKKEPNRINIRHSRLLCCWKKSFGKRFQKNVDNKKFQDHFRRLKSKKRAQIKALKKRLAKAKDDEDAKDEVKNI